MSDPDFRALCADIVLAAGACQHDAAAAEGDFEAAIDNAAAALARTEPESAATQLAARPLLEKVARMADCIDQRTVGEIMAISDQAAAWLEANPPGQPIAIEPRGCPTPGACSCVEPVAPTDEKLMAAARKAVDTYPRGSELPYFLYEDSSEYEPMLLALRAAARWGTPNPITEELK